MSKFLERTETLIGKGNIEKLKRARVGIFGLGGVGSYTLEALARCGIEKFILVDKDIIEETNINRQILALKTTIGHSKVSVAKDRILNINSGISTDCRELFYKREHSEILDSCDYVIDAIDTISSKIDLIENCCEKNIKIFSSMGTANKKDPTKFKLADIYSTSVCPVCKIMRKELKKKNIKKLDVVYSSEMPCNFINDRSKLGTMPYVPATAGLLLSYALVNFIIKG